MAKTIVKKILSLGGLEITRTNPVSDFYRSLFKKYESYTMVPESMFYLNLELCDRWKNLEGDYVECGVWRGGMSAAIAEVLGKNKHVHLVDSFEGLPPAKEIDGREALQWQASTSSATYYDNCAAGKDFAIRAMALAGHTTYTLHEGWFEKTLPHFPKRAIAILRLDGDWYDSVMVCLQNLFPLVQPGGLVVIDDYYTWDGCSRAVHDYLSQTKSPSRIFQFKNQIAFIEKKNA